MMSSVGTEIVPGILICCRSSAGPVSAPLLTYVGVDPAPVRPALYTA